MAKILVFDSKRQGAGLDSLWASLADRQHQVRIFCAWKHSAPANSRQLNFIKINLPVLRKFSALLPLTILTSFIRLALIKIKFQPTQIILVGEAEKLYFSLPARLLGLRSVWLFLPQRENTSHHSFLLKLFQFKQKCICFNEIGCKKLQNLGIDAQRIILLPPAAALADNKMQDTIFSELAGNNKQNGQKRFFTILCIADLTEKQSIELLFTAVRNSLTVSSGIQIVIIGDGGERNNLRWLAQKMEIGNLVWFIGRQEQLKKWFDSSDIYAVSSACLSYEDYANSLKAASAGLPVLCPADIGLEDIFTHNENAYFYEEKNAESLTQAIIALEQKDSLRKRLSNNAKIMVDKDYGIAKITENFEKIIQ